MLCFDNGKLQGTSLIRFDRGSHKVASCSALQLALPVALAEDLPSKLQSPNIIDKATTGIDAATARARRQIELLEEYRTRLIADVVTGKLDVREAAAGLPDEPDDADGTEADQSPAEDVEGEFARAKAV